MLHAKMCVRPVADAAEGGDRCPTHALRPRPVSTCRRARGPLALAACL